MKIIPIKKTDVREIGRDKSNFIFGASGIGRDVLSLLHQEGVTVKGIWDNDVLKQGKYIDNVPIISYEELRQNENCNLFIACNYAIQEEERIDSLINVNTYWIGGTRDELERQFEDLKNKFPQFVKESNDIKCIYADQLSCDVSDAIIDYIVNCNGTATQEIVSREDHYLVKEVLEHLKKDAVFVDLGAYTGEFPASLVKNNISFQRCYCFEMEELNMHNALDNMKKLGIEDKVELVGRGVSEKVGFLYFEGKGPTAKLVDYKTDQRVEIVTIDSYFPDTKIDFIKMDIEGAELGALKGGIHVIKRDRPILAISVYHSLEDRVDIPRYLHEQLTDYDFYLRQHSIWEAETVLYAIPKGMF